MSYCQKVCRKITVKETSCKYTYTCFLLLMFAGLRGEEHGIDFFNEICIFLYLIEIFKEKKFDIKGTYYRNTFVCSTEM